MPQLFQAFLEAIPEERHARFAGAEVAVAGLLAAAGARWPGFPLAETDFARHLGRTAAAWIEEPADLAQLHVEELGLAWACTRGVEGAVAALDELYRKEIMTACRWAGADPVLANEVWTDMLAELTTPLAGDRAGLADYAGRGPLRAYLRAVAVRKTLRARGKGAGATELDGDELPDITDDPALRHLKREYQTQVEDALTAAFAALSPRDKTLLRQHHIDGLGIDQLAVIHGIHRATAARRVAAARRAVLDACLARLSERLELDPAEVKSIIRLVRSRIDLSVGRYLAPGVG